MKSKGFTLIEAVVVIAILAILALFGVGSIIEFQKNSLHLAEAEEFASILRDARTRSLTGQLLPGEQASTFEPDGLPEYGVKVAGTNYILFRQFQLWGAPAPASGDLETYAISDKLLLTPSPSEVIFDRVTGESSFVTFTLTRKDSGGIIEVEADAKGVSLKKL
ncbi:MAG: prepilin-type N-terminal cleavage/methylation domain-containing protein [bacterium]|nr:prepilin-type N-terminal cleavage/methylation domain-containing protein [bacterium]